MATTSTNKTKEDELKLKKEKVGSKQLRPLEISTNMSYSQTSGSRGSQVWRKGLETPPVLSRAMKEAPRENHDPSNENQTINIRQALARPGTKQQQERTSKENESNGIFSWSDEQLAERYNFIKEVGFGNWGSCWRVTAKQDTNNLIADKEYAIKLVHRHGTPPSNARVKALWNEYKVLRSCGKPGHPNLVHFKEFIITPSYALVAMDYYRQAMNVALPVSLYAGSNGYFKQLLSSINWLHERKVTHCDIKVANLLVDLSEDKVRGRPILVDFGFATLHDSKTNFHSTQTWGTPEYLSPERSRGENHDERLSDVWALGVTFFEIATGRTPFEQDDEQFLTKEQLDEYYRRTMKPEWVGTWSIPKSLEKLCKRMLSPDSTKRIFTQEALQHPFFREDCSNDLGDIDASLREELSKEGREVSLAESLVYDPINDEQLALNLMAAAASEVQNPPEGHLRPAQSSVPTNFGASPPSTLDWDKTAQPSSRGQSSSVIATPDVSFSSFNFNQCTPPCVPKKGGDRREQVKIVVDESDSEDIRNHSFTKNSSSASEGHEDQCNEDVRDANMLLQQQQQEETPKSGSIFKELVLTTPSKSGLRARSASDGNKSTPSKLMVTSNNNRSPYPPSASRKVPTTKVTSSSERRHSQQDSPNDDSSIMVNGTSFEMANSATKGASKQDLTQTKKVNRRSYRDSEMQSSISHNNGGTSINGDLSTQSPVPPLSQSALQSGMYDAHAVGSIQTSLNTRISNLSRMEHQIQEVRRNSFLQSENYNGIMNPEHIFRRLEEMDDLANTLASMVRETRSVLQQFCGQEVQSPSSNSHQLPQLPNHSLQHVLQLQHQNQNSACQYVHPPQQEIHTMQEHHKVTKTIEPSSMKKHKRQMSISKLNVFSSRRKQSAASTTNALQMSITSSAKNTQSSVASNLNKNLPNPVNNLMQVNGGNHVQSQQSVWVEPHSGFFVPCNMSQEGTEILMRDANESLNHHDLVNETNANQANWWQHGSPQISDLPSPHQGKNGKFVHQNSIHSTKKKMVNTTGRPNSASGVVQPFCQSRDGKQRPSEPESGTGIQLGSGDQQHQRTPTIKQKVSKVKVFNLSRANSVSSTPGNRSSALLSPKGLAKLDCLSGQSIQSNYQHQQQDVQATINCHSPTSTPTMEKHSPTISLASISQVVAEGINSTPTGGRERETNSNHHAHNVQSPNHSGGVLWRLLTNRGANSNRNMV